MLRSSSPSQGCSDAGPPYRGSASESPRSRPARSVERADPGATQAPSRPLLRSGCPRSERADRVWERPPSRQRLRPTYASTQRSPLLHHRSSRHGCDSANASRRFGPTRLARSMAAASVAQSAIPSSSSPAPPARCAPVAPLLPPHTTCFDACRRDAEADGLDLGDTKCQGRSDDSSDLRYSSIPGTRARAAGLRHPGAVGARLVSIDARSIETRTAGSCSPERESLRGAVRLPRHSQRAASQGAGEVDAQPHSGALQVLGAKSNALAG